MRQLIKIYKVVCGVYMSEAKIAASKKTGMTNIMPARKCVTCGCWLRIKGKGRKNGVPHVNDGPWRTECEKCYHDAPKPAGLRTEAPPDPLWVIADSVRDEALRWRARWQR
jgi:hypothetical protein